MAADDDDDMQWLDIEKSQDPLSDEDAEYQFPELEMGLDLRLSERELDLQSMGRLFPDNILSREFEPEGYHVQCH
jgi:hypothetical protein